MEEVMDGDVWLRRRVVLIIISVASILALLTIGAAILHPYLDPTNTTPTILENWGGLIIGFYFGTIVNLLKDWMSPNGQDTTKEETSSVDGPRLAPSHEASAVKPNTNGKSSDTAVNSIPDRNNRSE
jgi:hypothetical protein